MAIDMHTAGPQLRAEADREMISSTGNVANDIRGIINARPTTVVERRGQLFALTLTRLQLDAEHGISVYVLFISHEHATAQENLTDAACDEMCRAIYDVKWNEGPLRVPGMRWFIRARKEPGAAPGDHFAA